MHKHCRFTLKCQYIPEGGRDDVSVLPGGLPPPQETTQETTRKCRLKTLRASLKVLPRLNFSRPANTTYPIERLLPCLALEKSGASWVWRNTEKIDEPPLGSMA